MADRKQFLDEDFNQYLLKHLPRLKTIPHLKNKMKRVNQIRTFIDDNLIPSPRREHRFDNQSLYFESKELRKALKHDKNFDQLRNQILRKTVNHQHSSNRKNTARGYRFTKEVKEAIGDYIIDTVDPDHIQLADEKDIRKGYVWRNGSALRTTDINGNRSILYHQITIPQWMKVNVNLPKRAVKLLYKIFCFKKNVIPLAGIMDNMDDPDVEYILKERMDTRLHYWLFVSSENEVLTLLITLLKVLHQTTEDPDNPSIGYIPNDIQESKTGRLYNHHPSIQNIPSDIRDLFTYGMGYTEYDLNNAQSRFLYGIARQYDIEVPAIEHYIKHKNTFRNYLADTFDLEVDQVKQAIIAILFGANPYSHTSSFHSQIIPDHQKATDLLDHWMFKALVEERDKLKKPVLSRLQKGRNEYQYNDLGKPIKSTASWRKKMVHVLQGLESVYLKQFHQHYPDQIIMYIHDAVIAEGTVDTSLIEQSFRNETGLDIDIGVEELSLPRHRLPRCG